MGRDLGSGITEDEAGGPKEMKVRLSGIRPNVWQLFSQSTI